MSTTANAPREKFLLVKGRAGLGNRILCLLAGLLYARVSGRTIVVDWRDEVYSQDGSNVFPRFFTSPSLDGDRDAPDTDSVAPAMWRGHLHEPLQDLLSANRHLRRDRFNRESSIDLGQVNYDADVAVLCSFYADIDRLRPHFTGEHAELSRMSNRAILRSLFTAELRLAPDIMDRVERIRKQYLQAPTVGVHVRMTDFRTDARAIFRELDELLAREGHLRIFAATDNIEAKRMLERRYPDVVTAPHWYPARGAPMHKAPDCPDRTENGIEALVDLYLLGSCDFLIGDSRSAFTSVAGLLLPRAEGTIIDVKPRPSAHRVLAGRAWDRYTAQDLAITRGLRACARGLRLSNLPARTRLLLARGPGRHRAAGSSQRGVRGDYTTETDAAGLGATKTRSPTS